MPTIRKLEADEVRRGGKGQSARARVQQEYDAFLSEFEPDEYGEAVLNEDESKLTVRNRLRAAAQRQGLSLNFLRTPGQAIRFQVLTSSDEQATDGLADAGDEAGAENGIAEESTGRSRSRRKVPGESV